MIRSVFIMEKTSTCHYLYLHFRWDDLKEESIQADHLCIRKKSAEQEIHYFDAANGGDRLILPKYRRVPKTMERSGFTRKQIQKRFTMNEDCIRRDDSSIVSSILYIEYARIFE